MSSVPKTRDELVSELEALRARVAELERGDAKRERLVQARSESEERFQLAVRGTSDGLWDWDVGTGEEWWSRRYRELIGYNDDELPATYESWESLLHPDDREYTLEAVRRHFEEGQEYDIEYRLRTKDEGYRWFLARGVATRDKTGRPLRMAGSIQDITKRKRSEEALRRSECIVSSSADMLALVDKNFVYLAANDAYLKAHGKTSDELTGSTVPALLGKKVFDTTIRPNAERCLAGEEVRYEEWFEFPVSGRRYMDIAYSPYTDVDKEVRGFVVGARDITEHKRAEDALQEQAELNQIFLDSLPPVAMLLRPHTREIVACNQAGKDIGAVPGKTCFETWGQRDTPCPWCRAPKLWATGEAQHLQPEGLGRVWDARWIPVTEDLYLHYAYDITEQKRIERAHRGLEERLNQAQKMEAVGQLAGGVAHDFNNLLTAILGNTEMLLPMLQRELDDRAKETAKSGLEQIKFAGQRAAGLTRQLLGFSRKEMIRAEVLDLNRLVEETEKMLRRLLRADVAFHLDVAPGLRCIHADAGQIEQVIMNLVLNARDAMPQGGKLTVACVNVDVNEAHAAAQVGAKPGPHVMLAVSDTGVGMSRETMDRMFEPFFTTKPTGKGTGLGLATVHGIVRQAGAHILVESEPGKGSTFRVYFPAVEEKAAIRDTAASVEGLPGDEVILVCGDEELVRRVVCQILRTAGYTILEARNGKHALDVAAAYDGRIDLLLSDVIMPEMNGKELAEVMVRRRPGIRVMFISGYTDDVLDRRVLRSEAEDFLQKPFGPTALLQRVRELLDESQVATHEA